MQFRGILRSEIRQPGVLGVLPHVFNGVSLRRVVVQPLGDDLAMLREGGFHDTRTTVVLHPVPEDGNRAADMIAQLRRNATVSSPWALTSSGSSRK